MQKVTNEQSPHFGKQVKIIRSLDNEKVEAFLLDDEVIVELNLNDIAKRDRIFKPKSRKDFYEFAQKHNTSRIEIYDTVKELIKEELIVLVDITEVGLLKLINELEDKSMIVDELRSLRDRGVFEFKLVNNNFSKK
jgi:hypothetical protein